MAEAFPRPTDVDDEEELTTDEDDSGDDEDDDDEEDSEEEESDSDQEPKLKYERIQNQLKDILNKEAASCMAVHTKFLAVGTHWGTVHVLDHQGHKIEDKEIAKHLTTVNQISLDNNADYLASCADDGKVAITGLYEDEHNQVHDFDCPIKSVALDPKFSRHNSNRQFVTGGDKLVLHEKGFLGRSKSTVLHHGEGIIRSIHWCGDLIAWANDQSVRVYDTMEKRLISVIVREHDQQLRSEIYHCSLHWKNESTLLIGWANSVKICKVSRRQVERREPRKDLPEQNLPRKTIIVACQIQTDFFVCGVAPLGDDLVVLAFVTTDENQLEGEKGSRRPQLKIISPREKKFETVSSDALTTRGFQKYSPCNYHLEFLSDECIFYIVSPLDVIIARQRDKDDHILWLLQNELFEQALEDTKKYEDSLHRYTVQNVGGDYINHLINKQAFQEAAGICQSVLGTNMILWEAVVYQFAKRKQLRTISNFVPTGDLRLPKCQYEMMLNEFLQDSDLEDFHKLIEKWPHSLYDLATVISAVSDRLNDVPDNPILLHALAELYSYDHHYDKALAIYLKLKHKDVFVLIHKHNLFKAVNDKIVLLMDFDNERAVKLLIDNADKVPIKTVVDQLKDHKFLLYNYLHALFIKDSQKNTDLHSLLVELYAEFSRERLMQFLKISNHYPLQLALQVCKERNYVAEMVFLFARMGNVKQALRLIVDDLDDVNKAIEFCKEQDDVELWEDLIESSITKPVFITGLLNNIGTHVDPIILIKKIESGMEIEGLRDSLVKILHDYNLQISLRDGCKNILVSDCFTLLDKLNKMQKKGLQIQVSQSCSFCNNPLFNSMDPSVIVFYCHHSFHEDCLINQKVEYCLICHSQQKRPTQRIVIR